jgi:hypothetical protein
MPKRLPVVLCLSNATAPLRQRIEQPLIDQLTLEPGTELNLIPELSDLNDRDTGHLCLEGIRGDMVLAGWMPIDDAFARLSALGIPGRRGEIRWDADPRDTGAEDAVPRPESRTIYWLDLSKAEDSERAVEEIRRIRDHLQTATIVLQSTLPTQLPMVELPPPARRESSKATDAASRPPGGERDALDHLLDELDALDL